MQATTPIGSRTTMPAATPRALATLQLARRQRLLGRRAGELGVLRQPDARRRRPAATRRPARSAPVSAMVRSTSPRHLALELLRRLAQQRAALGAAHARPRPAARTPSRAARAAAPHLLDRALRRVPRRLLGGRVDDLDRCRWRRAPSRRRSGPCRRWARHDRVSSLVISCSVSRRRAATRSALHELTASPLHDLLSRRLRCSAASRCRVVLCTGSLSNFGSTCLPKVSIERSTCFWSSVRVSGA